MSLDERRGDPEDVAPLNRQMPYRHRVYRHVSNALELDRRLDRPGCFPGPNDVVGPDDPGLVAFLDRPGLLPPLCLTPESGRARFVAGHLSLREMTAVAAIGRALFAAPDYTMLQPALVEMLMGWPHAYRETVAYGVTDIAEVLGWGRWMEPHQRMSGHTVARLQLTDRALRRMTEPVA